MHHLIRYYGVKELGKCNQPEMKVEEGEDPHDWKKPTHFVGEWTSCGKPTGRIFLEKKGAAAATREAIKSYF